MISHGPCPQGKTPAHETLGGYKTAMSSSANLHVEEGEYCRNQRR